jgi:hypothetical protein
VIGPAFPKPVARPKERTPWRRTSRLQAKRWGIRPRRPRRLDGPGSDPARLSWIHTQRCLLVAFDPGHRCEGVIEAAHEGKKPGVAMKCPDSETVPFCSFAHQQWQKHKGFFRCWPKAQRREWMDARIAETTARYLSTGNRRSR